MINIDYDELKKESFLRQKVLLAFTGRITYICLGIIILTDIVIWFFSVPFIITTTILALALCCQFTFSHFMLGRYMIKRNISKLTLWSIFRKNYQLEFIIQSHDFDNDSKDDSFETLIKKLTNNFESKNYEYFIKYRCDSEIFSKKGITENHILSDFDEILCVNFRNQEDMIAFKLMI